MNEKFKGYKGVFLDNPFGLVGFGRTSSEIRDCCFSLPCIIGNKEFDFDECPGCWSGNFASYLKKEAPDFWDECLYCLCLIKAKDLDPRMLLVSIQWAVEEEKRNFLSLLLPAVGLILGKSGNRMPVISKEMISKLGGYQRPVKKVFKDVSKCDEGLAESLKREFPGLMIREASQRKLLYLLDLFLKSVEESRKPLKAERSLCLEIEQFLNRN